MTPSLQAYTPFLRLTSLYLVNIQPNLTFDTPPHQNFQDPILLHVRIELLFSY